MEQLPIYALKAGDQISPVYESPLGLFDPERIGPMLTERYGIPQRYLTGLMSPWAVKRVAEFDGDISKFTVVRLMPSKLKQIGVAKTEPGDDNNQDISSLVGKVDIRKLEFFGQSDPDAYSYSVREAEPLHDPWGFSRSSSRRCSRLPKSRSCTRC